jgi:hypothetical protein
MRDPNIMSLAIPVLKEDFATNYRWGLAAMKPHFSHMIVQKILFLNNSGMKKKSLLEKKKKK